MFTFPNLKVIPPPSKFENKSFLKSRSAHLLARLEVLVVHHSTVGQGQLISGTPRCLHRLQERGGKNDKLNSVFPLSNQASRLLQSHKAPNRFPESWHALRVTGTNKLLFQASKHLCVSCILYPKALNFGTVMYFVISTYLHEYFKITCKANTANLQENPEASPNAAPRQQVSSTPWKVFLAQGQDTGIF